MTDLAAIIAKLQADKAEHEKQREQAIAQANFMSGAILQIESTIALLTAPEPNGKETEQKKEEQPDGNTGV